MDRIVSGEPGHERFLCPKAEKPTAQTSKSDVIDAEAIPVAWRAK
jgi:hypothetical protein